MILYNRVLRICFILIQLLFIVSSITYGNYLRNARINNVTHKRDYIIDEIFIQKTLNDQICKATDATTTTILQQDNLPNPLISSKNYPSENEPIEDFEREKSKTFVDYYYNGVQAYLINDWELCINHLERSLILFHEYYEGITTCRIRCENERKRYYPRHPENYEDQHFYEALIYKTLCLERCRTESLPNMPRYFMFYDEDRTIFKTRKPYEYLQICYYRDKEIEKAISAAYTVLVVNPNDSVFQKNLKFYSKLPQFDDNKLQDLEDKRFSGFYQQAIDKYQNEQWEHAIELFEVSMDIWLQELEKCRVFCEGEYNHGWLPDFTTSVSNHYVYALRCKQNCTYDLSYINGKYNENLFPNMYDYLQYAYYKNNNTKEAAQCAASHLLFFPNAETTLKNMEFYKSLPEISDEYFQPRSEAKKVFYRTYYEQDLLNHVDEQFVRLFAEVENQDQTSKELERINIERNNHTSTSINKEKNLEEFNKIISENLLSKA